jgi:beta-lactamase regulating signal transducer with metallopeptidase domain/HEAT repeat protein
VDAIVTYVNTGGESFVSFALAMLIQSSLVIAIVLGIDLIIRRRVKAVFRYWLWMLVLVKLLLPTGLSSPTSLMYWIGKELPIPTTPGAVTAKPPIPNAAFDDTVDKETLHEKEIVIPASSEPVFESVPSSPAGINIVGVEPTPKMAITWQGLVFLAWLAAVITMCLLLIQRAFFVKRLVAQADTPTGKIKDTFERCRKQIDIRRSVSLKLSPAVTSPSACGIFRPAILIPQKLSNQLDQRQLKAVIIHELAHVKRGDLWVSMIQTVLQIAYIYNLLLWAANVIIRKVREQAVDETVLVAMGEEAEDYPQTLLDVFSLSYRRPKLGLTLIGVIESKKELTGRIRHMVSRPFPKKAGLGALGLIGLVLIAVILLPMAKAKTVPITDNSTDINDKVDVVFEQIHELEQLRKERSRQYLSSLPDEDLAKEYARATAPQKIRPDNKAFLAAALEKVKQDRQAVLEQLFKSTSILSDEDSRTFEERTDNLTNELAALGPEAINPLIERLSLNRGRNWWRYASVTSKAINRMGPQAVDTLIKLMNRPDLDSSQRDMVAKSLRHFADPRSKDVLITGLVDDTGGVRLPCLQALIAMGPDVVGKKRLNHFIIDALQDDYHMVRWEAIRWLGKHGDESAVGQLEIIERYHIGRGKGDMRYQAGEAINAILSRAGYDVKEVKRDSYDNTPSSRQELYEAAACPNAAIRRMAINWLDRHADEQTAQFLIDRILRETSPIVLDQIGRSAYSMLMPPKETASPPVSAPFVQGAFDAFVDVVRNLGIVSVNIDNDVKEMVVVYGGDFPWSEKYRPDLRPVAIQAAGMMLRVADYRKIKLENVDRFKNLVLESLNSKGFIPCYRAVTSLALYWENPKECFSPDQKKFLYQQLVPLLKSSNPEIRLIECLGFIADSQLTPDFVKLLKHNNPTVRSFAASALGRIGDPDAIDPLRELAGKDPVQHENGIYPVRKAAEDAIEKIESVNRPQSAVQKIQQPILTLTPVDEQAVLGASFVWLKLVDDSDVTRSLNEAEISLDDHCMGYPVRELLWTQWISKYRLPLGKVKARKHKTIQQKVEPSKAPYVRYAEVNFESSFEYKSDVNEVIKLIRRANNPWRVKDYTIDGENVDSSKLPFFRPFKGLELSEGKHYEFYFPLEYPFLDSNRHLKLTPGEPNEVIFFNTYPGYFRPIFDPNINC